MNLKITKADIDEEGYYKNNSVVVDGSIEIDGDLGTVRFRREISASQFILAKAGEGIEAGLSISCKSLSTPLRVFAGLCSWRIPSKSEMTIIGKIEKGIVAYGVVNEESHV